MVGTRGDISKKRKPITRSTKTKPLLKAKKTNTNEQDMDVSMEPCQICKLIDHQDIVQCDKCLLWFHFGCANVTSDIENHDWQCERCKSKEVNPINLGDGAITEPAQQQGDSTRAPEPIGNSTVLHKSGSTTSSTSRKKELALKKLEEETILRQQREKEYLDQKYAILEEDSDQDVSFDEDEFTSSKLERVRTWNLESQFKRSVNKIGRSMKQAKLSSDSQLAPIPIPNMTNAKTSQIDKNCSEPVTKANVQPTTTCQPVNIVLTTTTTASMNMFKSINSNRRLVIPTTNGSRRTATEPFSLTDKTVAMTSINQVPQMNMPSSAPIVPTSLTENQVIGDHMSKMLEIGHALDTIQFYNQTYRRDIQPSSQGNKLLENKLVSLSQTTSSTHTKPTPREITVKPQSNKNPSLSTRQLFLPNSQPFKIQQTFGLTNQPINSSNRILSSRQSTVTSLGQPSGVVNQTIKSSNQTFSSSQSTVTLFGHPITSISQPYRHPSVTFTQPYIQPSVALSQPYMQPSVTFSQPYIQPSVTFSQPYIQPSVTFSQPYMQPSVTFSQSYMQPNVMVSQPFIQNEQMVTTASLSSSSLTYSQPVYSSSDQWPHWNTHSHGLNQSNQCKDYNSLNPNVKSSSGSAVSSTLRTSRLTAEQIAARHIMPKDLPDFYGNPKDWLLFKSAYDNANEACGFTDAENLGRLLRCLKGEAKETVRSRLLHASSVPAVIRTLTMMYGRPELIVESWIEDIKRVSSPKDNDLGALIKYAIAVQNLCGTIKETEVSEYLRNPTLMNSIIDKLPSQVRLNWAYFKHSTPQANLATLGDWLYELADVATQVVHRPSVIKPDNKKRDPPKDSKNQNFVNSHVECEPKEQNDSLSNKKARRCPACKNESCVKLFSCKKFKESSHKEKWSLIKDNRLCSRCFGYHQISNCRSKRICEIDGCKQKHNTILHNHGKSEEKSDRKSTENPTTRSSTTEKSHCNSHRNVNIQKTQDIFRIVPVTLYNNKIKLTTYAYMDDGSNLTTMEDSLADELGLSGTHETLCALWAFGEITANERSRRVSLQISGVFNYAPVYDLFNVRTVNQLHLPVQSVTSDWLNQYKHLQNLPIATYESKRPRLIIGLRYSNLMVSLRTVEGGWNEPIACKTRLGWVIQGPNDVNVPNSIEAYYSMNTCECQENDHQLQHLVKQFFSFESFGVKLTDKMLESKEIQRARQILESTTKQIDGRYETGLIWRHDDVELPNSYPMALKRLECLDRKLAKDPRLAEILNNQIQDFIEKGYIRKLRTEELRLEHPRIWYLPTFPVFNPKKPQKVRTVWDAAAKVKNVSLNSMLLTGPDQLSPLPAVLRRFREKEFAITGDIREMFHQIRIKDEDQVSQRFLWRDRKNQKPDVYVMQVMTFGATCSPSAAQFVKNQNALEFKEEFPRAVEAIIDNHYIDDMLEGAGSVEEAVRLTQEVKSIHQKAGFELRNFTSNSLEVLKQLGEKTDHQTKNLNITIELATERVLGMFWNTATDNFNYSLKFTKLHDDVLAGRRRPTKREVLRTIMSIFDPLGLIANFLVYGKILLQEIWREGIDWDESLPDSSYDRWLTWINVLPQIEQIQIPRWYSPKLNINRTNSIQLHVFVDASIEACATVAFYRIEDQEGVDCCLIGAKTKVAPNKPMSIPRLELQAGVLGTRLADSINKSQRIQSVERFFWSDSQTVLSWVNSEARKYHQFVAFRVGEILETSSVSEWHWIDTKNNVADDGTKWKKTPDFSTTSRWFKGPSFLYRPQNEWNMNEKASQFTTDEEMRSVYVMAHLEITKNNVIDPKEFSCWRRLVRTLAHMLRFVKNLKLRKKDRQTGPLTRDEYVRSQNTLYQQAQRDHFMEEILTIRRNDTLPIGKKKELQASSVLRTCSPYLDENGILRVRGRIDAANSLTFRTKRPIILPRHHQITRLIVQSAHQKYHHMNHQTVLNDVNLTFYVPSLRTVLKSVIHNTCQRCKNDRAEPAIPEMADLPPARLATFTAAFTYVGIDYFGPMEVKLTRNVSAKRWGVLITCLTSRAVHIEIAHSLNTSSCIMAIENFTDIRGTPSEIYSDCGSNFKAAEKELRKEFEKLNKNQIQDRFTNELTKWSFNPPKAAHMGGSWERLIRSVKKILDKSMPTRKPTDEMLRNFLCGAANIINSRPLTYVQLDHVDDDVLTPNHLLLGSANGRKAPGVFNPNNLLRDDWKAVQEMMNQFWRRFNIEFLPTLTRRTKWFKDVKPLEIGDVVIVVDHEHERNTWPIAIVEEVFMGKQNKIRSARVRIVRATEKAGKSGKLTKSDIKVSHLVRPVAKLAVLDVKGPKLSSSPEAVNEEGYVVNAPSGHIESDQSQFI